MTHLKYVQPAQRSDQYFCWEIFNERSNMVQLSGSAVVYTSRPLQIGIADGHSVNHSRKPIPELSRGVEVLGDVVTKEMRAAACSTNLMDPTWRRIKEGCPPVPAWGSIRFPIA